MIARSCRNGAALAAPRLTVARNRDPAGDELLGLRGRLNFSGPPPAIDPAATGIGLTVRDGAGAVLFTRRLPPGTAWQRRGRRWTFHDPGGTTAGGITRAVIVAPAPGRLAFRLKSRRSDFHVPAAALPVSLTLALGGPGDALAGRCGAVGFGTEGGARPVCRFVGGDTLVCD